MSSGDIMTDKQAMGTFSRRQFAAIGIAATATAIMSPKSALSAFSYGPRKLSFRSLHTQETLSTTYWSGGEYNHAAIQSISYLLRDHRNGEVKMIDPELLDMLYVLHELLDSKEPYHVISAYRSPASNALLRRRSRKVAKNSFHMRGQAIDIRLPDRNLASLRDLAKDLQMGGVGYYRRADFVHLDSGSVRSW